MAALSTTYNPSAVMMGRPSGSAGGPYLWGGAGSKPPSVGPVGKKPITQTGGTAPAPAGAPAPPTTSSNILAPESIRATGTGPFDSAYRQNLATYAGGQFSRPGGSMSFNPTDPSTFPGNPTGGGTAPVLGMPTSLMDMALGGQGFSWTPPPPAQTATSPGNFMGLQQWIDQFMRGGRNGRMGVFE